MLFDFVLVFNEVFIKRFNCVSLFLLFMGLSMGFGLVLEVYGIGVMWVVVGREVMWKFILGESMKFDVVYGGIV